MGDGHDYGYGLWGAGGKESCYAKLAMAVKRR